MGDEDGIPKNPAWATKNVEFHYGQLKPLPGKQYQR
jgi:hypothetical protein